MGALYRVVGAGQLSAGYRYTTYWNRVQHLPPLQGTTVANFGKFEQVWCQGGKCM
jgi:hypothetical protein